jgi:hypothetical protein
VEAEGTKLLTPLAVVELISGGGVWKIPLCRHREVPDVIRSSGATVN